jgi:predicted glutamine amidotransferase
MTSVVHTVAALAGGRMNMLVTDGGRMTATTWGDSLYIVTGEEHGSLGAGSRAVASEPFDEDPAWRPVPDRCVVEAGPEGIHVVPMERVNEPSEREPDEQGGVA